jgi:hypothetical protein
MVLQQAKFIGRDNIAVWLNKLGLINLAVEVGTHRAEYASKFLSKWDGTCLCCVDPWRTLIDYTEQQKFLTDSDGDREKDYKHSIRVLEPFSSRVQVIRKTSKQAVSDFGNSTLDFVYIDGNHNYDSVCYDINAWWPKVRSGGILSGHDFISGSPGRKDDWGRYIQPAVTEFADEHDLFIYLIPELDHQPWSWYIQKPE